ncbi:regulatory protein [Shewanella sp. HN-41]|nr:regulatory protein [Shewanella sp. HN-41]
MPRGLASGIRGGLTGWLIVTLFEKFEKHKTTYIYLLIAGYLLINNSINATSNWMETTRDGSPSFSMWEPFSWEYSSAISTFLLLPVLFFVWPKIPLRLTSVTQQLVKHFAISLVFSAAHVFLMVWLRKGIYWLAGDSYHFGPVMREFFYEYRKDLWGYVFFFALYHLCIFVYRRLKGEANLIENEPAEHKATPIPDYLLVKKLDREFLVKVADIEWMESSGNYVNLYSGGRIYPLRSTLVDLIGRLRSKGFSRIHRSFAVNHNAIEHIAYLPSGDGEIQLKSGRKLNLSRRYKEEFKSNLV